MQLFAEAFVVGALFVVLFALVHILMMAILGDEAMRHPAIFGAAFSSAFLFHIVADVTGMNAYYCALIISKLE